VIAFAIIVSALWVSARIVRSIDELSEAVRNIDANY
jgi:hypothetical protein